MIPYLVVDLLEQVYFHAIKKVDKKAVKRKLFADLGVKHYEIKVRLSFLEAM